MSYAPSLQDTVLIVRGACLFAPGPDWDDIINYLYDHNYHVTARPFSHVKGAAAEIYLCQVIDSITAAKVEWDVPMNGTERYLQLPHHARGALLKEVKTNLNLEVDALFKADGFVFAGEAKSGSGPGYLRRPHAQNVLEGYRESFAPHQEYVPWVLFSPADRVRQMGGQILREEAEQNGHIVIPMAIEQGVFEIGLECSCRETGIPLDMDR
ncbi:MAG: hypothetical protein QF486_03245 [Candidatus Woesearchaeota archaeon]|jgi:hypothetical protein|nr:hypothetical protein [Candidatus Woesearchaeota archaeon]MDP7198612.1 hypothetical protein [Candidatus Woesearchaeota archaeon]MDP7466646.1 hypothetical protein [Candidatus Woesearchaeota archaeon]MDP7646902.1 hypothetical protein [Candidatus Woesearchaeota archaeon]